MKANEILNYLKKVEKAVKPYGRTLNDIEVNFRRSDDSDIEQTDSIGIDLYDAEKNHIIESVVIMGIN
tara:strand:- start:141 stop:344 length:204 start_codon:yes stop_codon:yes gene_type:complete